ncbi:MAG: hypothetical protein JWO13_531 [Acidobacteriales bacterium]|nr:hypothetical protein [Terriglobales bacterium]
MSKPFSITHAKLVSKAVHWLRHEYRCGIVLSEQYCATGEIPDAIGWKGVNRSVLIECKVSRADFLADANKSFRTKPDDGLGCERFYLAPAGVITLAELPAGWGLLQYSRKGVSVAKKSAKKDLRSPVGLMKEMNLLLASLRRVELRIEPQTITEFLKWKNRMAEYNGGALPMGLVAEEDNPHLV